MTVRILTGDCRELLKTLPDESVHCCVTSPPYWGLRDYSVAGQIGLEESIEDWLAQMVIVFREVRRVLRSDGTLWLNLGDSYASRGGAGWQGKNGVRADRRFTAPNMKPDASAIGVKPKDLLGLPWLVAFSLRGDGWYLRADIVWHKLNPMPESVTDRPTKAHEYLFLLSKSAKYYYDFEAIMEPSSPNSHARIARSRSDSRNRADGVPGDQTIAKSSPVAGSTPGVNPKARSVSGWAKFPRPRQNASFSAAVAELVPMRNKRTVWPLTTEPFSEAHFATYPAALVEPCILAGCPVGGTVLDPFGGAGTTGLVADRLQRDAILIELNPQYADMARRRCAGDAPLLAEVQVS